MATLQLQEEFVILHEFAHYLLLGDADLYEAALENAAETAELIATELGTRLAMPAGNEEAIIWLADGFGVSPGEARRRFSTREGRRFIRAMRKQFTAKGMRLWFLNAPEPQERVLEEVACDQMALLSTLLAQVDDDLEQLRALDWREAVSCIALGVMHLMTLVL